MTDNRRAADRLQGIAARDHEGRRSDGAGSDGAAALEEGGLHLLAQRALTAGRLPRRPADRMWGGPGLGEACAVCGHPITSEQLGFEVEFSADGGEPPLDNCHLHIRCFTAWDFARQIGDGPAASGGSTICGCERDIESRRGPA